MTIASYCCEQLRTQGPMRLDALTALAVAAGVTTSRTPDLSVRSALSYRAVRLRDGRWASPQQLLEGRILTTSRDDEHGLHYDLELLRVAVQEQPLSLADGGELCSPSYGRLTWPTELWPEGGDLAGLRMRSGVLHVEALDLTPEMHQAGRLLAELLGPLKRRTAYWSTGVKSVSDALSGVLWDRLAADPDFLTAPVPPLSRCITPLAEALRVEQQERHEAALRWVVRFELPHHLRWVAERGADMAGMAREPWLVQFVERSLRELGESYDDDSWATLPFDELLPRRLAQRRP